MTNLTKFVDFSFKIFQGIASYLTIILTSKFLSIPDYSYFSVLGIMLVSICTIDFGFNTKLINSYLSRCDSSSNRNQRTQNHIFLQLFAKRKKTLFKIFIFQIVLIIPSYSVIEKVFKTSHSFIYFMVTFSSLFIMFL